MVDELSTSVSDEVVKELVERLVPEMAVPPVEGFQSSVSCLQVVASVVAAVLIKNPFCEVKSDDADEESVNIEP